MLFIDTAHQSRSRRQDLVDEDENRFLRAELDSLANNIDELTDGQIRGDEVLLLIDRSDVGFLDLLTDDLPTFSTRSFEMQREQYEQRLTGMRSAYF